MTRLDTYLPVDNNEVPIQLGYKDMSKRFTYNASGNIQYIGKAIMGTLSSSNAWQIKRLDYNASGFLTAILWASGSRDFEFIWDNVGTYSYL